MDKFLTRVTVTGADDSVSVQDLQDIQARYPFVEFGILFSKSQCGAPRHPSDNWLKALAHHGGKLRLAGHLCGQYATDFLYGDLRFPREFGRNLWLKFGRWQINTHGELHDYDSYRLLDAIDSLAEKKQSVIFQYDRVNISMIKDIIGYDPENVQVLFDLSHGTGTLPKEWPTLDLGVPVGFAGGLSPDNLASQIDKIHTASAGNNSWIDVETHLRSQNDALFDLEKVARFLEVAQPFVNLLPDEDDPFKD
jgi:hypothetical protein